jgi:hypothetical protein
VVSGSIVGKDMAYLLNNLPSDLLDRCTRLAENDPQAVGKFLAEYALVTEQLVLATSDGGDFARFKGSLNTAIVMTNTLGARVG